MARAIGGSIPNPPLPKTIRQIAMLGGDLPRLCGSTTFTSDLGDALQGRSSGTALFALAMNDEKRS